MGLLKESYFSSYIERESIIPKFTLFHPSGCMKLCLSVSVSKADPHQMSCKNVPMLSVFRFFGDLWTLDYFSAIFSFEIHSPKEAIVLVGFFNLTGNSSSRAVWQHFWTSRGRRG